MYIPKHLQVPERPFPGGHYIIRRNQPAQLELATWIETAAFRRFEHEQYQLHAYSRKRNRLYHFPLPLTHRQVIMKVSQISGQYSLRRRLNLYLSSWIKDYNQAAFYFAAGLEQCGIDSLRGLAHWIYRDPLGGKKSYFLYEYVDATMSVTSLCRELERCNPQQHAIIDCISRRLAATLREMHRNALRHGDPHSGNFLVDLPKQQAASLTVAQAEQLKMTLVDLDKGSFARIKAPLIKSFFDMKCLRRFRVNRRKHLDLLPYYLQNGRDKNLERMLRFWVGGGFNPYKWLRPHTKPY